MKLVVLWWSCFFCYCFLCYCLTARHSQLTYVQALLLIFLKNYIFCLSFTIFPFPLLPWMSFVIFKWLCLQFYIPSNLTRVDAMIWEFLYISEFASRSLHVGFVVDETGSGKVFHRVSPVFPYHKFHSTISPHSSHPFRFISSALVLVHQAWSASTPATHGPII